MLTKKEKRIVIDVLQNKIETLEYGYLNFNFIENRNIIKKQIAEIEKIIDKLKAEL